MDASAAAFVRQFETGTNLFRKALRDIGREALLTRPGARSNSMLWIAGHVTQFRYRAANILGAGRDVPWEELFATGAKLVDPAQYPDRDEILARWNDITPELLRHLASLGAEALDGAAPDRVASPDGSLRGTLSYLAFHESYHLGQLGFLRKWLGYSPLLEG
jgi:hypothetical protein